MTPVEAFNFLEVGLWAVFAFMVALFGNRAKLTGRDRAVLAIALFAFIAAAKQSRTWALAAMLLVGSALVGRFVSLAIDGFGPRVGAPIAIEAMIVAIFALAYWAWGKKPEGL